MIASFTPWLLYPRGQCQRYPLHRRLYGAHSWSWLFVEELYCPCQESNRVRGNISLLGYGLEGHYPSHIGLHHKLRRRPHLRHHFLFFVLCFWLLFSAKFRAVRCQRRLSHRRLWIQLQRKLYRTSYSGISRSSFVVTFPLRTKNKEPCKRVFLLPGETLGSSRKTSGLTDVIRSFELHFISLRLFASSSSEIRFFVILTSMELIKI